MMAAPPKRESVEVNCVRATRLEGGKSYFSFCLLCCGIPFSFFICCVVEFHSVSTVLFSMKKFALPPEQRGCLCIILLLCIQ